MAIGFGQLPPQIAGQTPPFVPGPTPGRPGAQQPPMKWWQRIFAPQGIPGMDPNQQAQMARQAMLQTGLGLMSAGSQGRGFGQGIAEAYGGAMSDINATAQQAFQNRLAQTQMEQQQAAIESEERRAEAEERRRQSEFERKQAELERVNRDFGDVQSALQSGDSEAVKETLGRLALTMRQPDVAARIFGVGSYAPTMNPLDLLLAQMYGGGAAQPGGGEGGGGLSDPAKEAAYLAVEDAFNRDTEGPSPQSPARPAIEPVQVDAQRLPMPRSFGSLPPNSAAMQQALGPELARFLGITPRMRPMPQFQGL